MTSGRLRFDTRPAVPLAGEKRSLRWKGKVIGEDGRTSPFWATVQLQIQRRVIRAVRAIPARSILAGEDVKETMEPFTFLPSDPSPDMSDLIGKETSRPIEAQQLIRSADLRVPQLVRVGQTVRVMVQSGQALLGLNARALNGGLKGDLLLVKNDLSGKTFKAEVTGPGTAMVRVETKAK
jgi:flagella basal body P-ring formation protein FlgA